MCKHAKKPTELSDRQWQVITAQNYAKGRVIIGNPQVLIDEDGDRVVLYGYHKIEMSDD